MLNLKALQNTKYTQGTYNNNTQNCGLLLQGV